MNNSFCRKMEAERHRFKAKYPKAF